MIIKEEKIVSLYLNFLTIVHHLQKEKENIILNPFQTTNT